MMQYVDSQEEMNKYSVELDRWANMKSYDYYNSNRKWLAMIRLGLYNFMFRHHFGFQDTCWWRPGLEMKFACEAAEKTGAKLTFMGPELDGEAW